MKRRFAFCLFFLLFAFAVPAQNNEQGAELYSPKGVLLEAKDTNSSSKKGVADLSSRENAGTLRHLLFELHELFGNSDYIMGMRGGMKLLSFAVAFVGLNGAVEAVVCAILGTAIGTAVYKILDRQ